MSETIYDPENAREWLFWKSGSLSTDDLQLFIKILGYAMLNNEIYGLFYERINEDREKNLADYKYIHG
jgi:hypothetical protein